MSDLFADLQATLNEQGAEAAISQLCEQLKAQKEYDQLFDARLLAIRHRYGIPLIPNSSDSDWLKDEDVTGYEDDVHAACREVGALYLEEGQFAKAWVYYRMIDEPEPVAKALDQYQLDEEEEDIEDLIQVALTEGVLPKKGFDWILDRFGLCSAITTLGSQQIPGGEDVRAYCIGQAALALYEELRERLQYDIEEQEGKPPAEAEIAPNTPGVIRKLMEGRDYLFGEHSYHVDLSHLNSVVQMAMELKPGPDLELVRELCDYGARLSSDYHGQAEPPFEDAYKDYAVYLAALAGENVEEGIAHFRKKADDYPAEEYGSASAGTLVQLLLQLDRKKEAAEAACKYLAGIDPQHFSYVAGLCDQAKAYDSLTSTAKDHRLPVQFMAGLLAGSNSGT